MSYAWAVNENGVPDSAESWAASVAGSVAKCACTWVERDAASANGASAASSVAVTPQRASSRASAAAMPAGRRASRAASARTRSARGGSAR